MANGAMSADGNFPSDSGLALDGVQKLGQFSYPRRVVAMSIEGVPGTGAAYGLEVLLRDDDNSSGTWVPVKGSSLSGDGAAATGQVVVDVIGEAVRISADNGTTPGTDDDEPKYVLNVYEANDDIPQIV